MSTQVTGFLNLLLPFVTKAPPQKKNLTMFVLWIKTESPPWYPTSSERLMNREDWVNFPSSSRVSSTLGGLLYVDVKMETFEKPLRPLFP